MLCERCHRRWPRSATPKSWMGKSPNAICVRNVSPYSSKTPPGFEFKGPTVLHRRPSAERVAQEAVKVTRS